jgi:hypothetical protein
MAGRRMWILVPCPTWLRISRNRTERDGNSFGMLIQIHWRKFDINIFLFDDDVAGS